MRRLGTVLGVLFLAGTAALSGCSNGKGAVDVNNGGQFRFVAGTPAGEVIAPGKRATAPTFSGTLLDGTRFTSARLAGHPAVINFWGSWCAPCRVETPEFQQVYAGVQGQGVQFLGVDVKDPPGAGQAFATGKGITYPSIYDFGMRTMLSVRGLPTGSLPVTLVLDKQGKVAHIWLHEITEGNLDSVIPGLVGES